MQFLFLLHSPKTNDFKTNIFLHSGLLGESQVRLFRTARDCSSCGLKRELLTMSTLKGSSVWRVLSASSEGPQKTRPMEETLKGVLSCVMSSLLPT